MQRNTKLWREAASIIILSKNCNNVKKWNYKILTVKRSSTMKFMPNLYTFPGGVIEKSDCVHDWFKLYESFGMGKNYFNKLLVNSRIPILKYRDENELPRYISLRISAIRETFEECGILICKPANSKYQENDSKLWASCIGGKEILKWQIKVQKDPECFLEMCYEHKIYPDIHSLHEWSNWMTPFTMPKQFDTIFFAAAFQNIPPIEIDKNEIQAIEWANPFDYLKFNNEEKIMFAPPQIYEISKMYNFYDIEKVMEYAQYQSCKGCDQILPYRIQVWGKIITILPGDDLYPDKEKLQQKELTFMDKLPESKVMHRIIHTDNFHNEIVISNYSPKCLLPHIAKKTKL